MTTTPPTTPTVTLAYAMEDRGLPYLATDGQHYAYGETAERALAELASVAAPDPMADQTTWTTFGVSDAERAAIVAAHAMIGRTFRYRGDAEFTVSSVNDCRPAHNGASVHGTYRYVRTDDTYNGSTWVADLGAERVAVTFAAPMADGSYSVDGLKLMSLADADRLIVAAHPRRGVIVGTNGAEVAR